MWADEFSDVFCCWLAQGDVTSQISCRAQALCNDKPQTQLQIMSFTASSSQTCSTIFASTLIISKLDVPTHHIKSSVLNNKYVSPRGDGVIASTVLLILVKLLNTLRMRCEHWRNSLLWHFVKGFSSVARSLLWQMNTLNDWHGEHLGEVPEVEKLSIPKGKKKIKLHNGQSGFISNYTGLFHIYSIYLFHTNLCVVVLCVQRGFHVGELLAFVSMSQLFRTNYSVTSWESHFLIETFWMKENWCCFCLPDSWWIQAKYHCYDS